jgi:glucosyl-3-phosphoglycerate phosphatase
MRPSCFTLWVNAAPPSAVSGVLLIRHGLTQWNVEQRWQGWADVPLSDVGRRQATVAARSLAILLRGLPDVRIVSSDLDRAYSTARSFAEALGIETVERVEALRERHVGDWSGLTAHEITQRWPGVLERWRRGETVPLPGGEDEEGFRARVFGTLSAEAKRSAETGVATVIVSHGGAIRTIESLLDIGERHIANVGGRWFFWHGHALVPGREVDLLDEQSSALPGDPTSTPGPRSGKDNGLRADERSTNAAL